MDSERIYARVKAILTTPGTEWPIIADEPATVARLYTDYIVVVAALPAIAGFIRSSLIGQGAIGVSARTPIGSSLAGMLLHYVLSLLVVYLVALVIDALAPAFGGRKNPVQALKCVAYAWTAGWVGGIAVILPWLGWLIAVLGVGYGIYLLFLGLPHTMKCPAERAGGYAAVTVIIALAMSWIVGLIVAGTIGTAALTAGATNHNHVAFQSGGDHPAHNVMMSARIDTSARPCRSDG